MINLAAFSTLSKCAGLCLATQAASFIMPSGDYITEAHVVNVLAKGGLTTYMSNRSTFANWNVNCDKQELLSYLRKESPGDIFPFTISEDQSGITITKKPCVNPLLIDLSGKNLPKCPFNLKRLVAEYRRVTKGSSGPERVSYIPRLYVKRDFSIGVAYEINLPDAVQRMDFVDIDGKLIYDHW